MDNVALPLPWSWNIGKLCDRSTRRSRKCPKMSEMGVFFTTFFLTLFMFMPGSPTILGSHDNGASILHLPRQSRVMSVASEDVRCRRSPSCPGLGSCQPEVSCQPVVTAGGFAYCVWLPPKSQKDPKGSKRLLYIPDKPGVETWKKMEKVGPETTHGDPSLLCDEHMSALCQRLALREQRQNGCASMATLDT